MHAQAPFRVERPEELEAVGTALHLLEHFALAGATRLTVEQVIAVRERLMLLLDTPENMRVEVEAYRLLDGCLPPAEVPDLTSVAQREGETVVYDSEASIASMLHACIAIGADVKIDYFSKERAEMNTRILTPHRLLAETYLQAYCHARKDERTFRLQRITRCIPVGGRPKALPPRPAPASREEEPAQMSLLDLD